MPRARARADECTNADSTLRACREESTPDRIAHDVAPQVESPPIEHAIRSAAHETWRRAALEPTIRRCSDARSCQCDRGSTAARSGPITRPDLCRSSEAPQARSHRAAQDPCRVRIAMAPQRDRGPRELLEALLAESLQQGQVQHLPSRCTPDGSIVFSVASMVEPGTFDLDEDGRDAVSGHHAVRAAAGTGAGHACAQRSGRVRAALAGEPGRHAAGRARRAAHSSPHRAHAPGSARVRAPPAGGGRGAGSQSAHL